MSDRTLRLPITAGNLRQNHIYISGHHEFFPETAFGTSKRKGDSPAGIEIFLDGLDETVITDIRSDSKTGKPRGFLRGRSWVRRFFEHHEVKAGSTLSLEKLAENRYRLSPGETAPERRCQYRAGEFFAGIGLVRVALERKGWNVVFANDIDPQKAAIYLDNWPGDPALTVGDIYALDPGKIPDCDLFTASFPCNDLSIAGRWEGLAGKESSAFWGFVDILRKLEGRRPPLVLLENVVGFLASQGGRDFEKALLALNELGYAVDAFILNAVHWVPQSRARLFVVARLNPAGAGEDWTAALASDSRPVALMDFIYSHPNIRWKLEHLPPLPKSPRRLGDIVEDLHDGDVHWWNTYRTEYFMAQLSEKHRASADAMIRGNTICYATAFRRVRKGRSMAELRTDGIAGCLRTPRGGSGRQILFKAGLGRYQVRLLTARECARLQGVPDDYVIDVPLNQALFGFGDAVCVPAIEWILDSYLTPAAIVTNSSSREE